MNGDDRETRSRRRAAAASLPAAGAVLVGLTTAAAAAAVPTPGADDSHLVAGGHAPGPPARGGATADTVVDGFHGYEFGTPASRIGEVDATEPPDARLPGLDVYARTLRFIGMRTRAYFYLDSADHRLRRGKHLIEPDASACVRQLTTLRLMLSGTYPDLRVDSRPPRGGGADVGEEGSGAAPARCRGFLTLDASATWTVRFTNPASGAVEARLELFRRAGEPRILACYLNDVDCAWPDSVELEPGPGLLAPDRRPDTAGGRSEPRRREPGSAPNRGEG